MKLTITPQGGELTKGKSPLYAAAVKLADDPRLMAWREFYCRSSSVINSC